MMIQRLVLLSTQRLVPLQIVQHRWSLWASRLQV